MLLRAKILVSLAVCAFCFWGAWSWRADIADAREAKLVAEANADYAKVALERWKTQTKLQEVTDELAKRNAKQAQIEAKTREQVAAAVARYAATHHSADAPADCPMSSPDWLRIHDASTGTLSIPAPASSRFADPAVTALAVITHNNGEAVACQRRLSGWQEWYSDIKKPAKS